MEIRLAAPGDLGWTFMRQIEVYAEEFGYSSVFERYVAKGLPEYLDAYDPARDAVWIAWAGERRVGCISIQHDTDGWAKLRWYLVEPDFRGQGLGGQLMAQALDFARQAGYDGIRLWTCSDLEAARRQYERVGFALAEQAECPWKERVVQQRFDLRLV